MRAQPREGRVGAVCAIAGALVLFVGTCLHPMDADPNDPLAAFTEYAASSFWVAAHLIQLLGVALLVAALVLLAQILASGRGRVWARLGSMSAIAGLAVAAALQAVDGVALKRMVDAWAAASGTDKTMLFAASFAVRQIETGLAAMMSLTLGCSVGLFGLALAADRRFAAWLGWLGLAGGVVTAVAGVIMAHTGFSDLAMVVGMPANAMLLVWACVLGGRLWANSGADESDC